MRAGPSFMNDGLGDTPRRGPREFDRGHSPAVVRLGLERGREEWNASVERKQALTVHAQFDSWGPAGCYDLSAVHDAITVVRK
jgi:hypothetical protein